MKKILGVIFIGILLVSTLMMVSLGIFAVRHPGIAIEFFERMQPAPTPFVTSIKGVGVIGDSLSDEYRADDRRGWTYGSTTLNWVELLAKYRNVNFGEWKYYEEPRREGYGFNFARTSETVSKALNDGQHTGLAEEIKKGKVNVVIMYIGVNDFSPLPPDEYGAIYTGSKTDDQITRKINELVADEKTMVETLQAAGTVQIILVTIPNWGKHAVVQLTYPIPAQRQRVSDAIAKANSELIEMAQDKGVKIADINIFYEDLDKRKKNDTLLVGNVGLNMYLPDDNPRNVFLSDGVHPGTVFNGLFANFIIKYLNESTGEAIKEFSDKEILTNAGI